MRIAHRYLATRYMLHIAYCSYSKEDWQELAILAVRFFINSDRSPSPYYSAVLFIWSLKVNWDYLLDDVCFFTFFFVGAFFNFVCFASHYLYILAWIISFQPSSAPDFFSTFFKN